MSTEDPGLADCLHAAGIARHDAGDIAIARALDLERLCKVLMLRLTGGGAVVISVDEFIGVDAAELDQTDVSDEGERAIRLELRQRPIGER